LFEVENADRIQQDNEEKLTRTIDICRALVERRRSRTWQKQQIASLVERIDAVSWMPPEGYQPDDLTWSQIVARARKQKQKKDWRGHRCTCEVRVCWSMV